MMSIVSFYGCELLVMMKLCQKIIGKYNYYFTFIDDFLFNIDK